MRDRTPAAARRTGKRDRRVGDGTDGTAALSAIADGQVDPLDTRADPVADGRVAVRPESRSRLTRWRSARRSDAV
jgi:hypothetical protein